VEVDLGIGFVTFVTLDVKLVIFPTTPAEKLCTPLTIDAAKSEPGRFGSDVPPEEGLLEETGLADGVGE